MFLKCSSVFYNGRKLNNLHRYICTFGKRKKICIVGSGPAGFYTAQHIFKCSDIEVDFYEKYPVPFGLIRYGVAPDHPEIKNVINSFTKIALNKRCSFFGNVTVGQDVKVSELLNAYDAVVLAYGSSQDKNLEIPGEDSENVLSARQFVGWYNGVPENTNEKIDLNTDTVCVIGHGNVALDVARILLRNVDELKMTDIAEHAFESLKNSRVKRVVLLGRRGPLQVAFTIKELREMTKLSGCSNLISAKDFDGVAELIPNIPRPRKRLTELMLDISKRERTKNQKEWELKFYRSPKAILSDTSGKVKNICFGINCIKGNLEEGEVMETREEEFLNCGLVIRSIGYQGIEIDSFVPFDKKMNIIPNTNGKVIGKHGLYCSGWVKTGPVGVILSTMNSSYETGEMILQDLEKLPIRNTDGKESILSLLKNRGVRAVTFEDWMKIDKAEQQRGSAVGKSRQKICDVEEMLHIAHSN